MVNTWVLHPDLEASARALDPARLFKQCVEARQIVSTLTTDAEAKGSRRSHPCVKQWSQHVMYLKLYFNIHLAEVNARGQWQTKMEAYSISVTDLRRPWFLDSEHFIYSHRASLKRKDPNLYAELYCPDFYLDYGYLWPSKIPDPQGLLLLSTQAQDYELINSRFRNYLQTLSSDQVFAAISPDQLGLKQCTAILKSGLRAGLQCPQMVKAKVQIPGVPVRCGRHRV